MKWPSHIYKLWQHDLLSHDAIYYANFCDFLMCKLMFTYRHFIQFLSFPETYKHISRCWRRLRTSTSTACAWQATAAVATQPQLCLPHAAHLSWVSLDYQVVVLDCRASVLSMFKLCSSQKNTYTQRVPSWPKGTRNKYYLQLFPIAASFASLSVEQRKIFCA